MNCPTCQGPTSVRQTRQADANVRRRRVCDNATCGHRFSTLEVPIEMIEGLNRGHLLLDTASTAIEDVIGEAVDQLTSLRNRLLELAHDHSHRLHSAKRSSE